MGRKAEVAINSAGETTENPLWSVSEGLKANSNQLLETRRVELSITLLDHGPNMDSYVSIIMKDVDTGAEFEVFVPGTSNNKNKELPTDFRTLVGKPVTITIL